MEARLLWEQEGFGSTPKRPTDDGSRGLVVHGPDKAVALSSILRATTC